MSKRKCVLNAELEKEYSFIKKTITASDVRCLKCNAEFSIANSGKAAIKQHLQTAKHKKVDEASAKTKEITSMLRPKIFNDKSKNLALKEACWAYHCVEHNHSFRSSDCTSKLIKKCFDEQYRCARTKVEAIIQNVFSTFIMESIKKELSTVNYLTLFSDCSNHGNIKMLCILGRYFLPNEGVTVKVLSVQNIVAEDSNTLTTCLMKVLDRFQSRPKLIGLCADNTNTNFGGAQKRGQNNVFYRMQKASEHDLIAVNCSCHVCNNCINIAVECLPVDIEVIIVKIYSFFYLYTIRVEKLKEICNDIDVEYKKLLGYSKTRWLTLLPALDRIIKLFKPLKEYFLQQEKCPNILHTFFENPSAEIWLHFIHSQATNFQKHILKMESQNISMIEVSMSLNELKTNLIERKTQQFVPIIVTKMLTELKVSQTEVRMFTNAFQSFYETSIDYLNRWISSFDEIRIFEWVLLKVCPQWEDVQNCAVFMQNRRKVDIDDGSLFNEFICVKNYVTSHKIDSWRENKISDDQKWAEIFKHFKNKEIAFATILKIVEFSFCLPGSNAPTERVFSLINNIWSSEKTQLKVETVEACLFTKCNLNFTCLQFYDFLKDKNAILKEISASEKYQ